jgi:UbiD family decarboxylase
VPRVKAVNLTEGGCGWLHAAISIDKLVDGDAKNALTATFGAHPSLKHAVVVDTDVDVYDLNMVEWAIATRFQANEDLVISYIVESTMTSTTGSRALSKADAKPKPTAIEATEPVQKIRRKTEHKLLKCNLIMLSVA